MNRPTLVLALAAAAACGAGEAFIAPTPANLSGTWTLRSVNGIRLPYRSPTFRQITTGTTDTTFISTETLAGSLTITATGTWQRSLSGRRIENGVASATAFADSGVYTTHGDTATFNHVSPQNEYDGQYVTMRGDRLMMAGLSGFLVFEKR